MNLNEVELTSSDEDSVVIEAFFKKISWANKCVPRQWLDGVRTCLLVSELYILAPCHCSKFEQMKQKIREAALIFDLRPGVILYGDCSHYDCDRISWEALESSFVVYWLGAKNQRYYGAFITRRLDGFDWDNPENWKVDNWKNDNWKNDDWKNDRRS